MIIGHKKILSLLDKSIREGRLAEAYLFCGPESVGKKKVAFYLAEKIIGTEKVEENPDFIFLEAEKTEKDGKIKKEEIKIEAIRELQRKISLSSFGNKGRVAVLDDVDQMNISAQNSLLKFLEEPREKTTIILITSEEKKLLPTIISRCRKVKFSLVGEEELAKMIPENSENKKEIIFWSFGRPGIAKKIIENEKELDFMKEAFQEFKKLFSGSVSDKFVLAEKIGADVPALLEKLKIWSAFLRVALLGGSDKIKISPKKSLCLLEEMEKSSEMIKTSNANPKLVLENLFLNF
jgi:DNA polymerase-3 subunit delta'